MALPGHNVTTATGTLMTLMTQQQRSRLHIHTLTHSIPQPPGREPAIAPVPHVGTGTSELRPPPEKERKQSWRGLDEVEEAQPELLGIKITQALTM